MASDSAPMRTTAKNGIGNCKKKQKYFCFAWMATRDINWDHIWVFAIVQSNVYT